MILIEGVVVDISSKAACVKTNVDGLQRWLAFSVCRFHPPEFELGDNVKVQVPPYLLRTGRAKGKAMPEWTQH